MEKLIDKNLRKLFLTLGCQGICHSNRIFGLFFGVLRGLQVLNVVCLGFKMKMKSRRKFS